MLAVECARVKNSRLNHTGFFSPAQWVLGKLPRDATALALEAATARALRART